MVCLSFPDWATAVLLDLKKKIMLLTQLCYCHPTQTGQFLTRKLAAHVYLKHCKGGLCVAHMSPIILQALFPGLLLYTVI